MKLEEYLSTYPNKNYKSYLTNPWPKKDGPIIEGMLLFNEETACAWGGPFPGNFAYFELRDCSGEKWLVTEEEQVARFINNHNKYAKRKLTESSENYNIYIIHAKNEYPTLEKPFRLRMAGTANTSYSVNFSTKEEALEFITLLEYMQPLDMHKDIQPSFAFTN